MNPGLLIPYTLEQHFSTKITPGTIFTKTFNFGVAEEKPVFDHLSLFVYLGKSFMTHIRVVTRRLRNTALEA